jgi:hypothetical protein
MTKDQRTERRDQRTERRVPIRPERREDQIRDNGLVSSHRLGEVMSE